MVSYLIIVLCVVAVWSGRIPALAFALFVVLHDQIASGLDGWGYYLSAGAFDVVALAIIAMFARPSRMATAFVYICVSSLFLNFYGWGIWLSYYSPRSYDISFLALYSVAIYVILRGDAARDEKCDNFRSIPTFWDKGAMVRQILLKKAGS